MADSDRITADYLRAILDYDPKTGVFTWKPHPEKPKEWNTRWAGKRAGREERRGYRDICVYYRNIGEHILAWLYMTGEWPSGTVDHENLVKNDNRWDNLRLATRTNQQHNRAARKDNPTGLKGVTFLKATGRYRARIVVKGVDRYLGDYATAQEAHERYCEEAAKLHGEFFRRA